jgi:CheY-like chemotaxis protein/anti-sigma regulatory factor (Ser/Thr protein kinase)
MLTTGNIDDDSAARAVETIYRNAKSQAQLIEDILDVSRIITGKLRLKARPILLTPIVQTTVESLRPQIEAKNIRLRTEFEFEKLEVNADPDRLQQVFWNLLSNAVKFTPAGGEVTLALKTTNANVEIVVSDTGKGISPDFLPFVFERFRQADGSTTRNHGGLGLGLAIVRHIVELHGGTVEVKSDGEGKGATFTVCLPLAKTPPVSPAPSALADAAGNYSANAESSADDLRLKGMRVLLVDDEKDSLELLATILAQKGVEVRPHLTVREALETVRNWKPDAIISDLAMPDEDGYSLIRKLRELPAEHGGATPAIALTAYVGVKERTKVLSSGFQLYVPKPVEPSELLAALASLIAKAES